MALFANNPLSFVDPLGTDREAPTSDLKVPFGLNLGNFAEKLTIERPFDSNPEDGTGRSLAGVLLADNTRDKLRAAGLAARFDRLSVEQQKAFLANNPRFLSDSPSTAPYVTKTIDATTKNVQGIKALGMLGLGVPALALGSYALAYGAYAFGSWFSANYAITIPMSGGLVPTFEITRRVGERIGGLGNLWRDVIAREMSKIVQPGWFVTTEEYFATPWGRRFLDVAVWDEAGALVGAIEAKAGWAAYTALQQLNSTGAVKTENSRVCSMSARSFGSAMLC